MRTPQAMNTAPRPLSRRQAGSTLIEVLVAALILSIGIMALVGVQGSSVQMAKMAQSRGDASRLAQDYADRIRANAAPVVIQGQNYEVTTAYNGNVAKQTIPTTCKGKVNCSPVDIALLDVAEMREQARLLLPNGAFYVRSATIGALPNQTTIFDIWVIWQTASTKSDETGTLTGTTCPAGAVASGTPNTQCLLTRFTL